MALQFSCSCGHLLMVAEDLAGKRVRCPSCRAIVTAPSSEVIPEARLVDATASAPSAAEQAQQRRPLDPVEEGAGPQTCCSGAAVGGFVISMGSLVFGLVSLTAPFTWPVLGLVGTAVSSKGLKRIREGRAPAHGAGLARAGMAIGIGQVVLAALFWAGVFVMCAGGSCGPRKCHGATSIRAPRGCEEPLVDHKRDARKIGECRLGDAQAPEETAPAVTVDECVEPCREEADAETVEATGDE